MVAWVRPWALLLVLSCAALAGAKAPKLSKAKPGQVAIGMDCGSSGSRVCVYTYDKDYESLAPVERKCLNIHPGLSSYADTPELAGRSLKPLFDHAIELGVPTGSKVYLAATAGLRMLPDRSAVDKIMESARMYLEDHYAPHLMWATHYPRVLSGNEEGVFGWAAVNHMMDRLGGPYDSTLGALDMGGSSTQITFVPKDPADVPEGYQFSFPWGNKVYKLYTHSFAGYGYNDARQSMLQEASSTQHGLSAPTVLIDPCALEGYHRQEEVGDQNITVSGTGNWLGCTGRCKLLLARNWPCMSVDGGKYVMTNAGNGFRRGKKNGFRRGGSNSRGAGSIVPCSSQGEDHQRVLFTDPMSKEFLALSNFAGMEEALGLPEQAQVGELLKAGKEMCSTPWNQLEKQNQGLDPQELATYCFGASYIYEVLHEGYHFPETMNIRFAKKLDSDHMSKVKISWTRGMILYELSKGQHASEHALMGYDTVSASDGAGINAFGGYFMLGLFGIACIGAAAYAFLHGPRELREVVSTKMHTGMERASEAVHSGKEMASSAAAKGKKLASSLPEQLPFEVPRVFTKSRANYNGYKDVEGESVSMTQPLSTRIGKHGKGYGSISSGDAGQQPEGAEGEITIAKNKFSFGTLFPQLQEAGSKLMRRSSSDTALSRLMPGKENASVAAQETEEEGACMVCAGRRKMGVEGLCGLCSQREDSKC